MYGIFNWIYTHFRNARNAECSPLMLMRNFFGWLVVQMMITSGQSNFVLISIGTKRTYKWASVLSNYSPASLIRRLISFLMQETPSNKTIWSLKRKRCVFLACIVWYECSKNEKSSRWLGIASMDRKSWHTHENEYMPHLKWCFQFLIPSLAYTRKHKRRNSFSTRDYIIDSNRKLFAYMFVVLCIFINRSSLGEYMKENTRE